MNPFDALNPVEICLPIATICIVLMTYRIWTYTTAYERAEKPRRNLRLRIALGSRMP